LINRFARGSATNNRQLFNADKTLLNDILVLKYRKNLNVKGHLIFYMTWNSDFYRLGHLVYFILVILNASPAESTHWEETPGSS